MPRLSAICHGKKSDLDVLLIEICPYMNGKHHQHKDCPTRECANAAAEAALIEQETDANGAENLRKPVHQVIQ